MFLIMGKEKIKVATAIKTFDGTCVKCFDDEGNRLVILEGVNFENVHLEDDEGNREEFEKEVTETEALIQALTDKVTALEAKGGSVE